MTCATTASTPGAARKRRTSCTKNGRPRRRAAPLRTGTVDASLASSATRVAESAAESDPTESRGTGASRRPPPTNPIVQGGVTPVGEVTRSNGQPTHSSSSPGVVRSPRVTVAVAPARSRSIAGEPRTDAVSNSSSEAAYSPCTSGKTTIAASGRAATRRAGPAPGSHPDSTGRSEGTAGAAEDGTGATLSVRGGSPARSQPATATAPATLASTVTRARRGLGIGGNL
jgi:hypothetical protein